MTAAVQVSVVIPMYNEERFIGQCLDSLASSTFPAVQLEVLVVDGGSSDRSREIVAGRACRFSSLRLLDNPKRFPGAAMNIAIANASGDYVVRMDAHTEYPPEYISAVIEELQRTGAAAVGGCCVTCPGAPTLLARAFALFAQQPFGVGNSRFRLGRGGAFVDTVPFGAFRRALFARMDGFREDLRRHEDYEFNARIRAAGGEVYLSDRICSYYYNVATWGRFLRQAWRGGYWNARCWLTSRPSFAWRHSVPLLFVAALVTSSIWGLFDRRSLYVLAFVGAAYAIAALISAYDVGRKSDWRIGLVMPAVFFSYHFVYGIATVAGALATPFARGTRPPASPVRPEATRNRDLTARV